MQHLTAKFQYGLIYGSQWAVFWWSLHLNVGVFMLHSHLHCFEIAITIQIHHFGVAWRRKRIFETNVYALNFLVLHFTVYCSDSLTFLSRTDPFTHCSIWEQVKCLVLPFLHPSIFMPSSLCPFLFLLITSPLIYDRTQENSFQVLICISLTLSLASLSLFLPSFPPSLYLCSGLCSAALRPCQNRNTPWFQSLRSL